MPMNWIGLYIKTLSYINAIQRYYNTLMPILKPLLYKNGGPILMLQVENEYGNYGCDHTYTAFLRDLMRGILGNDTVLYTSKDLIFIRIFFSQRPD